MIKLTLWPIQNKANRSMRQMAVLSPKMQELREKYKDDPTQMNQEVMKLYKQYGINPVGGCLPMMIQIPIFFGLFKMLGQAVELRNAKFLWIKDLSQPDTLAYLPVLGWRINLIPILMAATQIWLMAMTPKTGDPTQRRVMMFTPLIFLFICYNFAAALALYYTTQNLFSILQFYLNKRQPMPTLEKVAPAGKTEDDDDPERITRHDPRLSRFRRSNPGIAKRSGQSRFANLYRGKPAAYWPGWRNCLKRSSFSSIVCCSREDKDAAKVVVDCELYRSMREDRIVQRVRGAGGAGSNHGTIAPARTDEFLRATDRAQCIQGRSGCRHLEPIRFCADQANHVAQAPAEETARNGGFQQLEFFSVAALCERRRLERKLATPKAFGAATDSGRNRAASFCSPGTNVGPPSEFL